VIDDIIQTDHVREESKSAQVAEAEEEGWPSPPQVEARLPNPVFMIDLEDYLAHS
jgi:hypothetical protein